MTLIRTRVCLLVRNIPCRTIFGPMKDKEFQESFLGEYLAATWHSKATAQTEVIGGAIYQSGVSSNFISRKRASDETDYSSAYHYCRHYVHHWYYCRCALVDAP